MRYLCAAALPEECHFVRPRGATAVHGARQMHEEGGPVALEVQARLLARQSLEEVARCTPTLDVVAAYEALFFDVIAHLVPGTGSPARWSAGGRSRRGRDLATVVRGFAYHGGLAVVECSCRSCRRGGGAAGGVGSGHKRRAKALERPSVSPSPWQHCPGPENQSEAHRCARNSAQSGAAARTKAGR